MNRNIQAVVLAGGLGSRLGGLTSSCPKPMMDVSGRPFLDYLIQNLIRQGITEILLSVGHLSKVIRDFIENHFDNLEIKIQIVEESEPLGTGGALKNCEQLLEDNFFVVNGDTLLDVNYAALASSSRGNSLALRSVDDITRFGSASLSNGRIVGFREKLSHGPGLINGGVAWLSKSVLRLLPYGKSSIEKDLLPQLAKLESLDGFITDGFFIDIGLPTTLEESQSKLPAWEKKPIAFLDRDGVLNHDKGHVYRVEDFCWIEGAINSVKALNEAGYHVVVVTNQAGIAKGYYSENDFAKLTNWMKTELWKHGAHLDGVYYCPYHPESVSSKYRYDSNSRKPRPGMILEAMADLPHRKVGCFFVGDKETDHMAAEAAGIQYLNFSGDCLLQTIRKVISDCV